MKRAQEIRLFRAEFLELGGYRLEAHLNGSNVESIDSIQYLGHTLELGMLNIPKVIRALQSWTNVELPNGKVFTDQDLLDQLDSARKYPFVWLSGMFITLSDDPKALFRVCLEEDLLQIILHHPELQTNSEIKQFLDNGMFKVEPSILWHTATQSGGRILKIKAIQTKCSEVGVDPCGKPLEMRERPFYIRQLIRGETGIPELDELYPLGCSNTSVEEGVFYYADKIAVKSVWMDKHLQFDEIWSAEEPRPPMVPESAEAFMYVAQDGLKHYTLPADKHEGLQSPKVMKRLLMPGKLSEDPEVRIRGIVVRDMPSHDGILFYMPESKWRRWIRECGFDQGATAIKVICPFAKGMARALPDDLFIKQFRLPVDSPDIDCVMLHEAISNPERVTNRRTCETEGCPNQGMRFPAVDKAIPQCPGCGAELYTSYVEIEGICRNPACAHWGRSLRKGSDICPYCGEKAESFEIGVLWGNDLGQHDSDKRTGNPNGKASHQIVIRGAVDKSIMRKQLLRQLDTIGLLIDEVWSPPNVIWLEKATVEGKTIELQTTVQDKLLATMNMKADNGSDSTFRGAAALLKAGVFAGNPRVIGRVTEMLASMAIDSKQRIILPARKIDGRFVRFASPYVVPGFGLEPGEIRIPKSLKPLTAVTPAGDRIITLLRYPIRPGGTEMRTMKVVDWSYGNVLEVHPEPWSYMEGDFDGDTGTVLPVWITGLCQQASCDNPQSIKVPQPDSVGDVVRLAIQAYNTKADIGKVDVRNSEIITEFECRLEPIVSSEGLHLREIQQIQLNAFKHEALEIPDPPTARLKELLDMEILPKNPVNAVLYFRPSKSPSVPKIMQDFAKKEGLHIPSSKYQNLAWVQFMQRFAAYVLTDWPVEHPDEAYKVNNHPYKEVLKKFALLDFSKLTRLPGLDWQYSAAFGELHHQAMQKIESKYPDCIRVAEALVKHLLKKCDEYAEQCALYRQEREEACAADSRDGWDLVEAFCTSTREQVHVAVGRKAQTNIDLRDTLLDAIWAATGVRQLSHSPSFIFHAAPNNVISKAVRLYSILNSGGLDQLTMSYIDGHLGRRS